MAEKKRLVLADTFSDTGLLGGNGCLRSFQALAERQRKEFLEAGLIS